MNVVITMAGLGSRFKEAGYTIPKYMIEAHNKTLFEWSMLSLKDFFDSTFIFIVRKEDNSKQFINKMCNKLNIAHHKILEIDYLTDGQATTALLAKNLWDGAKPLLIYNIDTFVTPYVIKKSHIKGDGFVPCFIGEGDHWSFVKTDENLKGISLTEKVRISDYCTLGAYYFSSGNLYEKLYNEFLDGSQKERYIAPIYNLLIKKGMDLYISVADKKDVYVLGTPKELDYFIKHYKSIY